MIKKIVILLWVLFVTAVLAAVGLFWAASKGYVGYVPEIEELENPNYKFATQLISSDGVGLGTWSYSKENRIYVTYDQISPFVVKALIDTEDERFREHSGIDGRSLVRAIIKRGLLMQKNAGGGSTITQQLAKQLYSGVAENVLERALQKPIEWVIAVKLERYYTKNEILMMYLNKFDFLNNAVGIKTASKTYFSKDPLDLKIEEAATLIGMCKNPSYFNPLKHLERTRIRRNVVLNQMNRAHDLSDQECDSLKKLPLTLHYSRVDHKEGLATYFREYLRGLMTAKEPIKSNYRGWQAQQFYQDSIAWKNDPLYGWCQKNVKPDGTHYSIYTDGLKIHTTIDSRMQRYAEEAVKEHINGYLQPHFFKEKKGRRKAPFSNKLTQDQIDNILERTMRSTERYRLMRKAGASKAAIKAAFNKKVKMEVYSLNGVIDTLMTPMDSIRYYKYFLRAGFMSMDPHNGYVKAYVGGTNYHYFQYDMAMVGRRQVGSTIKPFLYSLAMENGYSPCDELKNVQPTIITETGEAWTPRNASNKRIGEVVTLKWGLATSNNWISAQLIHKLNPYALVRLIHSFGVLNQDIQPTPALCLGPCDISVGEMVGAYTAFVNKGIRVNPLFVTSIEDADGNVISDFTARFQEVIGEDSSYKMIEMLRGVANHGTGVRTRRLGITADIGAKTGTTNLNSDGWFMGITPSLVSGCWVGGEERDIHFDTMYYGQGAAMALPIWAIYMNKVYNDKDLGYSQEEVFNLPENYNPCKDKYKETLTHTQGLDDFFE
ncbi:MAG: transglycosylase domain-containing protein [Bacteroidaceae bacterium]